MTANTAPDFHLADLEQALAAVEPAALLVPPRILRRVIKRDRGLAGLGLQVPHRKSYVIGRDTLLGIADRAELDLAPDRILPDTLLLLERPDPRLFASRPRGEILVEYWRLLFHARIHLALDRARAEGRLTPGGIRERVHRLGSAAFDEIRAVLRQERFLLPPADEAAVYEEFAALYLELHYFAPHLLPRYFPSIGEFSGVDALLAGDLDAGQIFAATRPAGAPDPVRPIDQEAEEAAATSRRLMARADAATARGNVVRAAVLRMRAVWASPSQRAEEAQSAAFAEIERLTGRLQNALGFGDDDRTAWAKALMTLLEPAARGTWPVEARLLYDLQKVCVDHERPVYAVDLVEWLVTWGRRPVKRLLPNQREVLMVKHLRSSGRRLAAARLPEAVRRRLGGLLEAAIHHGERRLRDTFRPRIVEALETVDLRPANYAEARSRDKLVEELLDLVVERGFLNMSDLRDAVARNRLKLADLSGPDEFLLGDKLIRANRRFAENLDGVYHRGEIYLRWLQRLSSAAFGTRIGRFLTLYLVLPFGGAFFLLKAAEEMIEIGHKAFGPPNQAVAPAETADFSEETFEDEEETPQGASHPKHYKIDLINLYSVPLLGLFLFGLLHAPPFRRGIWTALRWFAFGFRVVFHDFPAFVLGLPLVKLVLQSRPYLLFYQFVGKPLPWAVPVSLILFFLGFGPAVYLGVGALVFLTASLLLNSRLGQQAEELLTDWLVRTWDLVRSDLLPGLFRFIVFLFKRLLEDLERFLYTVDEWLRFRPGDSRLSLVTKPILGLFWFAFTYVIRVVINLFVEPTFNPIKHFPVVTVTAKLLLPVDLPLGKAIAGVLEPMLGKLPAGAIAWLVVVLIPGFAGFLVWELKENWRLYRSNQSPTLQPVVVGHHGETVLRLMKPGLHSGTLPKLYAKLRANERRNRGRAARKQRLALYHVREQLRHFAERDLLALLAGSKSWLDGHCVVVEAVSAGTDRIRLALTCPDLAEPSLALDFEHHGGRLIAGISSPGWMARLGPEQARTFADALAGFYKKAGVDLVREQVGARLPPGMPFDLTDQGLIVWPGPGFESEAVYPLEDGPELRPRVVAASAVELPVLKEEELLFSAVPVRWTDWVDAWERDQAGKGHVPLLIEGVSLLPRDVPPLGG